MSRPHEPHDSSGASAPRASDPARAAASSSPSGSAGIEQTGRGRRVLVVDDESSIRAALRRFFTRRGWLVDEAPDGETALAMLTAGPGGDAGYAVVVSDIRMPKLSGLALHDRLLADRPALLQRFVFSTGDVASRDAAEFIERAHCPVLQKPFELSVLAEVVERVTGAAPRPE